MQTKRAFFQSSGALALCCSVPFSACSVASARYRKDLYACEGCDATTEVDSGDLQSIVHIVTTDERGERLILHGKVLSADGKAPVGGVVIYLHQTNVDGLYAGGGKSNPNSRRHGKLRGWAKSASNGTYEFHTIKPAPYPGQSEPAHIHLYIKEPNTPPYYIDNVVFDGEFLVNNDYRREMANRGGSGIVKLLKDDNGILIASRDIILERHPPA